MFDHVAPLASWRYRKARRGSSRARAIVLEEGAWSNQVAAACRLDCATLGSGAQPARKRRAASATVTVADSLIGKSALDNDGWSHAAAGAHGDQTCSDHAVPVHQS